MPIIKFGEIQIPSEDLDFPSSVTPTESQVAIKIGNLAKERNEWRARAEELQKREKAHQEREEKMRDMEGEMVLQEAVNSFKIDKAEVAFLKEIWKTNPMSVKQHLDSLRSREYLKREEGLKGDKAVLEPLDEVKAKALELMSGDKSLKEGEAMQRVLKSNPELSERYRASQLASNSPKGGDR